MKRPTIDLQSDPEVPKGQEMMEELVGAHMVATDDDELLHLVRHALDAALAVAPQTGLRVATHAAYRGQALIVSLLDLATRQRIRLEDAGIYADRPLRWEAERYRRTRLDLWLRLCDDKLNHQ